MEDFKLKYVSNLDLKDEGLSVKELLELINMKEALHRPLLKALDIEKYREDFIHIPGAKKLVAIQKNINNKFEKKDVESSLDNIDVHINDNKLTFYFTNLNQGDLFSQNASSSINAVPIYSSKNDFFSWLYGMDKYANSLIKNGLGEILFSNLNSLRRQNIGSIKRKYRILHNLSNGAFYVRAIVSTDRYHNYDNNVTVVIALLSLHRQMKKLGLSYVLHRVEYNESCIRIFFEEGNPRELKGIGFVKNIIEVSNDEVKRESLRFDAVGNIVFIDSENKEQEIMIQPSSNAQTKLTTSILLIGHNLGPENFVKKLNGIDKSAKIHDDLFDLISEISKVTKPSHIMFLVKSMVQKAKKESFTKYKAEIEKTIDTHVVDNMIQLLSLFKKMELITEGDIEASDYIRYIVYKTLITRRSN